MREYEDADKLRARIHGALRLADALRLYDVAARLDSALVSLSGQGAAPIAVVPQRDVTDRCCD